MVFSFQLLLNNFATYAENYYFSWFDFKGCTKAISVFCKNIDIWPDFDFLSVSCNCFMNMINYSREFLSLDIYILVHSHHHAGFCAEIVGHVVKERCV